MSSAELAENTPRKYQLFIDGQWVDSESGKTFHTPNPATGETLAQVAEADKADIDKAVSAARRAFEGKWSKLSARDRGKLLYKLSQLIEQHSAELAALETADNGKPIKESLYVDLPQVVENFEYFAGWATKIEGETIPVPGTTLRIGDIAIEILQIGENSVKTARLRRIEPTILAMASARSGVRRSSVRQARSRSPLGKNTRLGHARPRRHGCNHHGRGRRCQ